MTAWEAMCAQTAQSIAATLCASQALGVDSDTVIDYLAAGARHRATAAAIREQYIGSHEVAS
jgi:hypothetical protein